ncbi:hypothetical protein PILCRDRAFT_725900 [Piloderma croceum F 1598]|uniref:Uncharacterized protein n=1 Tax=Piloderma croceum (strain F 1598) TaxID=765440 RepID=A0A0C3B8G2_PILCF|nr:hypothetical protein PILCRDRAFT_725900 [Piloderma croceum F 1598]
MSVYGHTIQLLHQQSWLRPVLKFQISEFMNHKLSRNQISAGFRLPVHELYKNGRIISSPIALTVRVTVVSPSAAGAENFCPSLRLPL